MQDPLNRFFQNSTGFIEYSRSILEVDPLVALSEVGWDREKFLKRGRIYEWSTNIKDSDSYFPSMMLKRFKNMKEYIINAFFYNKIYILELLLKQGSSIHRLL